MYLPDFLTRPADRAFSRAARFMHKYLGLGPDTVSAMHFISCAVSAFFFYAKNFSFAYLFLALSLLFDGIDGVIARMFGLASLRGELTDTFFDRSGELLIFVALVISGYASLKAAALAYFAILLVTSLRKRARFDPGFKRWTLFLAPFLGFGFVFSLIFFINLLGFMAQLLIIDFREGKKSLLRAGG